MSWQDIIVLGIQVLWHVNYFADLPGYYRTTCFIRTCRSPISCSSVKYFITRTWNNGHLLLSSVQHCWMCKSRGFNMNECSLHWQRINELYLHSSCLHIGQPLLSVLFKRNTQNNKWCIRHDSFIYIYICWDNSSSHLTMYV